MDKPLDKSLEITQKWNERSNKMGSTTAQDTGNLQEWGQLLAGKWNIQSATPNEDGTIAVANGSHTIGWLEGRTAIEAVCIPPAAAPAARAGMRWMAMWDAASGQIKQTSIRADGVTEVAYISKQSNGEWSWRQTRTFPNGAIETNTATFTVSNGGKTLTQHVTNRVLTGAAQPLVGYASSAAGEASPHVSDVCNVFTQAS
jgi:hypothetical protein